LDYTPHYTNKKKCFFRNDPAPWRQFTNYEACLPAKFLLTFASTVIFGSEYHETHDHILLSDGSRSLQDAYSVGHTLLMHERYGGVGIKICGEGIITTYLKKNRDTTIKSLCNGGNASTAITLRDRLYFN
jgi:hypothetical protein